MRKVMPCKKCGQATLSDGKKYVLEMVPSIFSSRGCNLSYTCICGTKMSISRVQFNAIPNET